MLTYVYIGSVGSFENVYINKKKIVNVSFFFIIQSSADKSLKINLTSPYLV